MSTGPCPALLRGRAHRPKAPTRRQTELPLSQVPAQPDAGCDFGRKYKNAGSVAQRLLNRFFTCLETTLAGLPVQSALEVGCGEGFSTQRLRRMLPPAVGLHASDVEPHNVDRARQINPDVAIACESIYQLARPDRSYDLVLAMEVLEHLDDPAAALREVCRVTRRYVLLSVPREPLWCLINLAQLKYVAHFGNTPGHVQHWSKRGFRSFVQSRANVLECHTPFRWTLVLAEVRP